MKKILKFKYLIVASVICILIIGTIFFYKLNKDNQTLTNDYIVYFDTAGGTIIANQNVKSGDYIQQPDIPQKEGFVFLGWYLNNEKFDFESTNINEGITLVAKWEAKEEFDVLTILFDSQGGTLISNVEIKKGSSITEPITPKRDGYTFLGWYLNNQKFDFTTNVDEDIILIAKWKKIETNQSSNQNNTQNNQSSSKNEDDKDKIDDNEQFENTKPDNNIQSGDNQSNGNDNITYRFQYDAFERIICPLEGDWYYKEETGLCYYTPKAEALYMLKCPQDYPYEVDGSEDLCYANIGSPAIVEKGPYCPEGYQLDGDVCRKLSFEMATTACAPYEYSEYGECRNPETGENVEYTQLDCSAASKYIINPTLKKNGDQWICTGMRSGDSYARKARYDYSCPDGYTLDGNLCVHKEYSKKVKQYYCPDGFYNPSSPDWPICEAESYMIKSEKYTIEYYCPDGLIMMDKKCYVKEN